MTPIVPTRPDSPPPDKPKSRDEFVPTPPHRRRDEIAIEQGFESYWHKRRWLAENPEQGPAYDGRRKQPPPPLTGAA